MNKIDFSNVYKFLASIGLGLVSLGLALPYFVLKETGTLLKRQEDVKALTESSLKILSIQNYFGNLLLNSFLWISGVLILLGIIAMVISLRRWWARQVIQDKKEEAELKKLEIEIDQLSPSELLEKAIKETTDPDSTDSRELNENPLRLYFRIEERIYYFLKTKFHTRVVYNRKVTAKDSMRSIDILVQNTDERDCDIIIEVKFSQKQFKRSALNNTLEQLKQVWNYYRSIKQNTMCYLFIVQPDAILTSHYEQELKEMVLNIRDEHQLPMRMTIISLEKLMGIEYQEFITKYWHL